MTRWTTYGVADAPISSPGQSSAGWRVVALLIGSSKGITANAREHTQIRSEIGELRTDIQTEVSEFREATATRFETISNLIDERIPAPPQPPK